MYLLEVEYFLNIVTIQYCIVIFLCERPYQPGVLRGNCVHRITVFCFCADNLLDDSSTYNADDVDVTDENVDYDKMFDDNLLRLAHESKVEKEHNEVGSSETDDEDVHEENKVSSSREPDKRVLTRQMKKQMDEQEKLSDFDGEVSFRENLKRRSTDDEEDKRPIAKKSKRNLPCSSNGNDAHDAEDDSTRARKSKNDLASLSNGKEAQVNKNFSSYQELQSSIKV